MLLGSLAQAATLNFNGGAVAGCTYNGPTSTYTCSALLLPVYNDSVAIASGYTVVVNSAVSLAYNQSLQMSGSARLQTSGSNNLDLSQINPSLLNATGSLAAGGNFLLGSGTFGGGVSANGQASVATGGAITGSVTAASLQTGSSVNIGGTVGVSGTIDLGSSTTITGAVSGASISTSSNIVLGNTLSVTGNINLGSGNTISGAVGGSAISTNANVSMGALTVTGAVNLGSSNTINGSVSANNISTNSNVVVTGSVNVAGLADFGSSAHINGGVTAGSVQTNSSAQIGAGITSAGIVDLGSGVTVVGNISGTTITSNSSLTVTGNVNASNSFTLPSGSSVTGNITSPTVKLNAAGSTVKGDIAASSSLEVGSGSTITGNISGGSLTLRSANVTVNGNATFTGDVDIGSQGTINGDLSARDVTTHASGDYISGNAAVNSIYLDHGATVGKTITCTGAGSSNCSCVTKPSSYNYNPTCGAAAPSGPDHFQITHNGTALTCQPQTVTVTACANSTCTAPHYSAATQVTMSPGGQVATISGSGTASVQQFTAGNATLSASAAGVAKASTCVNAAANNASCTMAFSTQGLTVSVPDHLSMASGVNIVVQALQAQGNNPSCVPLLSNVTVPVAFGCSYTDPVNAAATPVQIQNQSGSYTSVACGAATSNVTLQFDGSGSSSTRFQYPEVGKVGLTASYTGTSAPNTGFTATGSTSFTAAPAKIKISVQRVNNTPVMGPGMFANASAPFTVTLSAINASTPATVTTNFGKENTPESFKPTYAIPSTNQYGIVTTGQFGPIINGVSTSVSGSTGQWNYSDVGYITISSTLANSTANYMGNPAAGFNTQGTLAVGRFVPDHFDVALPKLVAAGVTPARDELPSTQVTGVPMKCNLAGGMNNPCAALDPGGNFIYSNEPLYVVVRAYNGAATPALTQNYITGNVCSAPSAQLVQQCVRNFTLSSGGASGGAATAAGSFTTPAPGVIFDKGVGIVTATTLPYFTFTPSPTPTVPSTVYVRASDADLVSSARGAATTEIPLTVATGRMQIANNYGSETSGMPVTVQAQYYSAAGAYVFNAAYASDAQGIGSPNFTYNNCKDGKGVALAQSACPVLTVKNPGSLTFINGKASFLLSAPGVAGSADLTLIPHGWGNDYLPAVPGRATFGVYRSGPVIYTREVHN
jgi:MSHA biogenesis protein MshQ